jgi:hypothetical protein
MDRLRPITSIAGQALAPGSRPPLHTAVIGAVLALAALFPAARAHADALAMPSMTAPLSANATPPSVDGGPFGKIYVSGQVTGLALAQSNPAPTAYPGNDASLLDLSNAQVELQTTSGPVQFYVQAGAYALPTLGTSYVRASRANSLTFGPVPVAYIKLAPSADVTIQVGALPALIGAEYIFTFQNMNIERGLLWSQEQDVSKGVQVNYNHGPVLLQGSLNDGFDSGHYNWISGLGAYTLDSANTVTIDGGANVGRTETSSFRTPLAQNNSAIVNLAYTYSKGPLMINPYLQYTAVRAMPALGIQSSTKTYSGAVLAKYSFTSEFSLAARAEYESSVVGGCAIAGCALTNLLYGPGSSAASLTLTPTYQKGVVFVRAELSHTVIGHLMPGDGFGSAGMARTQDRALVETGVLF